MNRFQRGVFVWLSVPAFLFACCDSPPSDSLKAQSSALFFEEATKVGSVRPIEANPLNALPLSSSAVHPDPFLQAFVLDEGALVGQTALGLRYRFNEVGPWHEAGIGPRWIHAAVSLPGNIILVAGEGEIGTLTSEGYAVSPLGSVMDGSHVSELVWEAGSLWIMTSDGLFEWKDDALAEIIWPAMAKPFQGLVKGACAASPEGLWFSSKHKTYCTSLGEFHLQLWTALPFPSARTGYWPQRADIALVDHDLYVENGAQGWLPFVQAKRVLDLFTSPTQNTTWLRLDSEWALLTNEGQHPLLGVPNNFIPVGVDSKGALHGLEDQNWIRLRVGQALETEDLEPGETLYQDTFIHFSPPENEGTTSWTAFVDEEPIPVTNGDVVLVHANWAIGPHVLRIEATVGPDLPNASAELPFQFAAPPTWEMDIEPLYIDKCSLCHDPSVTTFPLNTRDLWMVEIEKIELALELSAMPLLPILPLTEEEVKSITAWKDTGFLE